MEKETQMIALWILLILSGSVVVLVTVFGTLSFLAFANDDMGSYVPIVYFVCLTVFLLSIGGLLQ